MSQEFDEGPQLVIKANELQLLYDFETDSGNYRWAALTFGGAEAVVFTSHESCNERQVAAYDALVEVINSPWLASLQAPRVSPVRGLRHMRIYFDEVGCFEVAATGFTAPSPSPAPADGA